MRTPQDSTLLRKISEARAPDADFLDKPWTIACQSEPETAVPPEGLQFVVQAFFVSLIDFKQNLTIREALWFSRLHALVSHLSLTDEEETQAEFAQRSTFNTLSAARDYATRERVCDTENRLFDTSDLDAELLHMHHQKVAEDMQMKPEALLAAMAAAGIPKPSYLRPEEEAEQ